MRALFLQLSSLLGLLVFLSHLWRSADIGRTVFVAVGTGLAVYVVLVLASTAVHSILRHRPAKAPADKRRATKEKPQATKANEAEPAEASAS